MSQFTLTLFTSSITDPQTRKLTTGGTALAIAMRAAMMNPPYDRVLCAPDDAALETAMILASLNNPDDPRIMAVPELVTNVGFDPPQRSLASMSNESFPLQEITLNARDAKLKIEAVLQQGATNVLVVGRGNLIPALGLEFIAHIEQSWSYGSKIHNKKFKVCEGIRFTIVKEGDSSRLHQLNIFWPDPPVRPE